MPYTSVLINAGFLGWAVLSIAKSFGFGKTDYYGTLDDSSVNSLARDAGDNFTGTAGYSAPEVCDRASPVWSRAADVWSVGCVMYAMLANSLLVWASDGPDFSSRMLQGAGAGCPASGSPHDCPRLGRERAALPCPPVCDGPQ